VTWRWPGCEADHTFPFNVKVKSEWSCTSPPRICLQGANRDDCTLALLFMFIAATVFDADELIIRVICIVIYFKLLAMLEVETRSFIVTVVFANHKSNGYNYTNTFL
jgi:hypothetical protein